MNSHIHEFVIKLPLPWCVTLSIYLIQNLRVMITRGWRGPFSCILFSTNVNWKCLIWFVFGAALCKNAIILIDFAYSLSLRQYASEVVWLYWNCSGVLNYKVISAYIIVVHKFFFTHLMKTLQLNFVSVHFKIFIFNHLGTCHLHSVESIWKYIKSGYNFFYR